MSKPGGGHIYNGCQIDETNNKQSFLVSARNKVTQIFHSVVDSLKNVPTFFSGLKDRVTTIFSANSNKAATNPPIDGYSTEHDWSHLDIERSNPTKKGFFNSLTEKFRSTANKVKNKASDFFTFNSTKLAKENKELEASIYDLSLEVRALEAELLIEKLLRRANLENSIVPENLLRLVYDISWFYSNVVFKAFKEKNGNALLELLKLDLYSIKGESQTADHEKLLKKLLDESLESLPILIIENNETKTHKNTKLYIDILTTLIGHAAFINSKVEVKFKESNSINLNMLVNSWLEIQQGKRLNQGQPIYTAEAYIKNELQKLEHKIKDLRFEQAVDGWIFIVERNGNQ